MRSDPLSRPDGGRRILREDETFQFQCHPEIDCFTRCCRNADMNLYPYDIIRLKRKLNMSSDRFLKENTLTAIRSNPYFPDVMLRMSDREGHPCPYLSDEGCLVYEDRPFSCRAYPLEPAVSRKGEDERRSIFFLVKHGHCGGHGEKKKWTVAEWMEDQGLAPYVEMNRAWVDMDTLFRQNPWGPQGVNGQAMKMAFMACYNMDKFREFVFESSFLDRFRVPVEMLEAAEKSDESLMILGFDWVRFFLTGQGPLEKNA